tara:strand:- start:4452 stop:4643 length:192 start_codon:yes stop_codon:yes gene_type:complete
VINIAIDLMNINLQGLEDLGVFLNLIRRNDLDFSKVWNFGKVGVHCLASYFKANIGWEIIKGN